MKAIKRKQTAKPRAIHNNKNYIIAQEKVKKKLLKKVKLKQMQTCRCFNFTLVRERRLELPRQLTHAPQT
ncbi:MAG: hypothetical protein RSE97_06930, partial [Oscillospiraceae bacterium]